MKVFTLIITLVVALTGMAAGARPEIHWSQPAAVSTNKLSNLSDKPVEKLIGIFTAPGASRVRVVLTGIALGRASKVRFTSLKDGQSQALDATGLAIWSEMSALFNGDSVRVELILAPGDSDVSFRAEEVLAFTNAPDTTKAAQPEVYSPETLCGADDRVSSSDNRVGRLTGGCTGWLVANGAVLTAGHCGIAAGAILEVNIPPSQADGTTVASAVQDQFPAVAGSITTVNSGVGNDYTVFRVGPNNLQQSVHQLYGFFRMTRELPGSGSTLRVTGCGIDNNPLGSQPTVCGNFDSMGNCTHFGLNAQNQTLQTSTGAFFGESGTSLQYSVDTEPANSGSPIIWEGNGFTIGIHTAGGCTSTGGSNNGTSFELDSLENAIAAVPGSNCRYLDLVKAPGGLEDGTVFQPHDTLAEAINAVPVGGNLSVVIGTYHTPANTNLTKAMTIRAPVGPVTVSP